MSDPSLAERLADALPIHSTFTFYHISTPPTKSPAIYSAPPGARPDKTYLESHFLSVSIRSGDSTEVLVLAIEIPIYSTKHLTTIFVSKADSTGYLSLLPLSRGHNSPLRTITSTFLAYLVEQRQRPHVRLVISLFARASDQYLFPGSVQNQSKHVSDDRQLVKWWCRVLDPVMRKYSGEAEGQRNPEQQQAETTSQAYLVVPGEDSILSFIPQDVRWNPELRKRWKHGHPLRDLTHHPLAPPRSLIPHFPDDPKARFLDELDDEIPDSTSTQVQESPSKRGNGQWRSVRTLEQFWEMMAFRQECSSGRLVGFMWIVFTPPDFDPTGVDSGESQQSCTLSWGSSDLKSFVSSLPTSPSLLPTVLRKPANQRRKKPLTGPIVSRMPKIKSASSSLSTMTPPEESNHYIWPPASRGELVLDDKNYKKATEILLRLDFANQDIATASTKTWIEEVGVLALKDGPWGQTVSGRHAPVEAEKDVVPLTNGTAATILGVKRKSDSVATLESNAAVDVGNTVTSLGAGLIKKKPKNIQPDKVVNTASPLPAEGAASNGISMLGAGLVRKKPKLS